MTIRAVYALARHLPDSESTSYLARNLTQYEVIPNDVVEIREMVRWAVDHYARNKKAPSVAALTDRYADVLERHEIDLGDDVEIDSVEEVLELLSENWVRLQAKEGADKLVKTVAKAPLGERVAAYQQAASEIIATGLSLQPRSSVVDLRESGPDLLALFEEAQARDGTPKGIILGLSTVDEHTQGTWPGELSVLMAFAKLGKSRLINKGGYRTWEKEEAERGDPVGIWTMENSTIMTQLHFACEALGLDSDRLYRQGLSMPEVPLMMEWIHDVLEKADTPLYIFGPGSGFKNTPESIVTQARSREIRSMFLDQISFISAADQHGARKRWEELALIMSSLWELINQGNSPLACMANNQVSREGAKEASKSGKVQAWHASDGGSIERFCSRLFALQATQDQMDLGQRTLVTVADRRVPPRDYDLMWRLDQGLIEVLPDLDLAGAVA
jgi:hypothetical protein